MDKYSEIGWYRDFLSSLASRQGTFFYIMESPRSGFCTCDGKDIGRQLLENGKENQNER